MGIKETLIRLGDIPQLHSQITLRDNTELCAENCRCVSGCDDNLVVLRMEKIQVHITGTELVLDNFGAYGVKVTGRIHSVTMEEL